MADGQSSRPAFGSLIFSAFLKLRVCFIRRIQPSAVVSSAALLRQTLPARARSSMGQHETTLSD